MAMAKWKTLGDALLSLESIRQGKEDMLNNTLLVQWCRDYPQHEHHLFPFGLKLFEKRRTVPRKREMKLENGKEKAQSASASVSTMGPPTEILVPSPTASPTSKTCFKSSSLPPENFFEFE
jgi:hypothetical protein